MPDPQHCQEDHLYTQSVIVYLFWIPFLGLPHSTTVPYLIDAYIEVCVYTLT